MDPVVAAVAILAAVVLILVFAMAGLLQRVKELERRLRAGASLPAPTAASNDEGRYEVAPRGGAWLSAVLVVQQGCGVCASVMPTFIGAASPGSPGLELVILTDGEPPDAGTLRVVEDDELHRRLDPGYVPAMLIVDADSIIIAAEPAGSPEAVGVLLSRASKLAERLSTRHVGGRHEKQLRAS